jgi:Mg/Co/Ni transporter MgtE
LTYRPFFLLKPTYKTCYFVGIITVDDLLELLAEEMTGLAKVALGQQTKEKRSKE